VFSYELVLLELTAFRRHRSIRDIRNAWHAICQDMAIGKEMKTNPFNLSMVLAFGLSFLLPACGDVDTVGSDILETKDESTMEAESTLKPNRRVIALFSDTTGLTLSSYLRQGGNQYVLDHSEECSAGAFGDFIVERSSIADVVGMKLGDWRSTLRIQNNGFDGCAISYGDFGQGPATRATCYLEDVRDDVSLSFMW
jgi:hypothetical protein